MLIVADVHLGKATHLNKYGQALPNNRSSRDMKSLSILADGLEARRVLILGDLFHSDHNSEFALLKDTVSHHREVSFEVVPGNHDILSHEYYRKAGITVHDDPYCMHDLCFTHDAAKLKDSGGKYIVAGHVHPGITLHGKGRQSLRLPCYYFGKYAALLPAFGTLTGTFTIRHEHPDDHIYVIAGEKISPVPNLVRTSS